MMAFQVARSAAEWKTIFHGDRRAVVSVGNFDGLHLGHQKIIRAVVERARQENALSAAITFDPHPLKILRPEHAPKLIMTLDQRLRGFADAGLDGALVMRFHEGLAQLSAEEFVERVLCDTVRARAILVGENFRFGHQQAGDVALLKKLGARDGFEVQIVEAAQSAGTPISSTAIRAAISEGRLQEAIDLLGHPFVLTGAIAPGEGRGSKLLFPTLNMVEEQEIIPAIGVYATETFVEGKLYHSVTNVGVRPTFDGRNLTIESHLFNFHDTVRTGRLELRFWARLREEKKFSGPEALRAQIALDIAQAKEFFDARQTSALIPR
jgi:riboflavin kinase/FMN adenylyltransferase